MLNKLEFLINRFKKELIIKKSEKNLEKKLNEILKIKDVYKNISEYEEQILTLQDKEMINYYKEEIQILKNQISHENIIDKILNKENTQIILEIRSGEGGQESELFAYELLEMYKKVCKKLNWNFKLLEINIRESGGIKDAVCEIEGENVDLWLMQESGVHCVKRVPKTEKKGRTHTSTVTIAILKQPKEIEINLQEKDLKIEVFRSSGPGGQSVNTTDSAVRITHIPTGIVASQQDEKSQHKNKDKAMKILKARIYAKKLEEEMEKHSNSRREAIGSAKRNERIRTYHFTQNWVNDSRIDIKSHNITKFMEGDELIFFLRELIFLSI